MSAVKDHLINHLPGIYEELLGEAGLTTHIGLNANIAPKGGDVLDAILSVARNPYKLDNIGAESYSVRLEFYMNLRRKDHEQRVAQLNTIVGLVQRNVTVTESDTAHTYYVYSSLDMEAPSGPPVVEPGGVTLQAYVLSGTILVAESTGAIVGNAIETKFLISGAVSVPNYIPVEVVERTVGMTSEVEAPLFPNDSRTVAYVKSVTYAYNYTVLCKKDDLGKALLQLASGAAPVTSDTAVRVREVYLADGNDRPVVAIEKWCRIASCHLVANAGEFAQVAIQLVESADHAY